MEPYVILGTIVSFIAFVDLTSLKRSRFLYFMLFSILVIFVGTRDHIGTDWWIYEGLFSGRDQSSLIEPGYRLLQVFTKTIGGNDFRYMVFTTSLISIGIKFDAFRKLSPLVYVSVLFYFGYYYIPQEANQVRQGLAAGILLFSIPNLLSGRIYKFLSVVLIAASFQIGRAH